MYEVARKDRGSRLGPPVDQARLTGGRGPVASHAGRGRQGAPAGRPSRCRRPGRGRGRPDRGRYTWAGEDADESALLASRADERQKQVGLRARALAGAVALAAAYAGLVITLAVKIADAWPFAALLAVTGFAYLLGLSSYGSGEPGPEDEVTAGHQTRSPASS